MDFPTRWAPCWLAVTLALSCSIDERPLTTVMPECEPNTDAPRCDDDFVQRCSAPGAWQRDPMPCASGCDGGVCVGSGVGPDSGVDPGSMELGQPGRCGNDGDACDDGLFCTVGDSCNEGECHGTPRDCDDGVACTIGDSCDEERNQCALGTAECPANLVCDAKSGDCTATCSGCRVAGICHADGASSPVNPCEVCDVATSADAFTSAPSSVGCDDAIACTENDRCESGSCAGTPLSCAADQRCVESAGTCQPIVPGCTSGGQRVCVDGDVHECDASLVSSQLTQPCDVGCDPAATPVACVGGYTLALGVAGLAVTQGSSASVSLTLVRDDGHVLPVAVTVQGLPPGVNVAALELSGTEDFATLTLSVAPQAAEGVRTSLTVRSSDGFSVVTQPLELFVRGEPGSLDLSFGEGGTARAEPPGAPGFQGTRVVVDGADRILVAATSRSGSDPLDVPARASLTRFSTSGALDTGFGDAGTYLEPPGNPSLLEGPNTFVGGVALASGGYVLAGPLGEGVVQEASYVTRLDAAGNRAAGFNAPALGGGLRLSEVAVEDGTIFAVGDDLSNAALFRSDLNGAGAQSFTDSSILGSMQAVFWSPADNDFILAGNCDPSACFARFNAESTPPQLNVNRAPNASLSSVSLLDAAADAQGRYFAIGTGWNLVRFLPDAVRPPGVQNFTVVVDALASSSRSPQGIERAGDRLYVAAALTDPASETGIPAVVRYSTTWARDVSFGAGGLAELEGAVEVGSSVDVAVQSDGRVIVATVDAGELVVYRVWD